MSRRISELSRAERFRYALPELGTTFINLGVMLNPKLNLTTEVRPVSLLIAVSGLSLSYDC